MLYTPDREVRWVDCECGHCNATGKIKVSRGVFREHLDMVFRGTAVKKFQNGKIFSWALDEYRIWKSTGEIDCPDCNGAGKWQEPR